MPCTICLECLTGTGVYELQCGHVLHVECLTQLIRSRSRRCPLCRHRIPFTIKQIENNITSVHWHTIEIYVHAVKNPDEQKSSRCTRTLGPYRKIKETRKMTRQRIMPTDKVRGKPRKRRWAPKKAWTPNEVEMILSIVREHFDVTGENKTAAYGLLFGDCTCAGSPGAPRTPFVKSLEG